MNLIRIKEWVREEWILVAILVLAFLVRIAGITYGLPLTLVADEPPFTLGALQMLQTHLLIPSLHESAFTVLYYPPYTSYLLLLPFVVLIGVKYLLWHGAAALFPSYVLSDLTWFFVTARLLDVVLGVASVYLVYRVAESLFRSKAAAAFAGFLLATSILHEALSMVGRQWLPVSFFFILILFILTRERLSFSYRYFFSFLLAGIAVGFSSIAVLAVVLIGLYYLLFDVRAVQNMWRDLPRLSLYGALFAALALLPSLLHSGSNGFVVALTLFKEKTLMSFLLSPWEALTQTLFSEPVLTGFFIFGLIATLLYARRVFVLAASFFILYVLTFYTFFRLEPRFIVPLLPLYALLGGFCIAKVWNKKINLFILLVLALPLLTSLRLSYLTYEGDTRDAARTWLLRELKPTDNVLVYAPGMRLPSTRGSLEELRAIDQSLVRKTDEAEAALDFKNVPHALNNLINVSNASFLRSLPTYAATHNYMYLVIAPEVLSTSTAPIIARLTKGWDEVARFDGFGPRMSTYESDFLRSFPELFQKRMLGPDIVIYHSPKTHP